jgi:hypothetical protein
VSRVEGRVTRERVSRGKGSVSSDEYREKG